MKADRIITYVVRIFTLLLATSALAQETLTPEQQAKLARQDEFQRAIVKRDAARVGAMIRAGMPVDFNFDELARSRTSESPLTMAINRGHLEIARILLEAGADPNRRNGWGQAAMQYAKSPEAVELLVKHGAIVDARNYRGYTALAEAVERGDAARVRLLLDGKADPKAADLFLLAVERGHTHLVPVLLERGADPRTPPTRVVFTLIENGDEATARMLLDKGADPSARNERGPLIFHAVFRQRWGIADALVDAGVDLRLPDGPDCAQTSRDCHSNYLARIATLNPPTLARMKARGLDLNARAANGHTALTALIVDPVYGATGRVLTQAAIEHAANVVPRARALLEQGADPNLAYRDLTPLMLAIATKTPLAELLVDAGGRVEYRHTIRKDEPPPAPYAAAAGARTRIPGASEPVIYNQQGVFTGMSVGPLTWVIAQRNPHIAARLLARDKKLVPEDRFLLYFAGLLGEWDIVLRALPYAKDVDASDRAGVTPLMLAAHDGRADAVKALLAAGAKVNHRSARDWPPLLEASPAMLIMGHSPSKPRLVGGYTALKAATERGHEEIAALLRAAGARD